MTVALWLLLATAGAGCGDTAPDAEDRATTTVSPQQAATAKSPGPASNPASPITAGRRLAAGNDGLGVVSFGDEAEAAIRALIDSLGTPDVDTGWQGPSDPANEALALGCPGVTSRLLQWTGNLGAVFTDWDRDLSTLGGTVPERYFAGHGLWATTPIRTVEGASPGMTLAQTRAIYGARLWISDRPDDYLMLYSLAIDGEGSPLTRTGPLRGWLLPPDDGGSGQGPDDDWTISTLTAGVACNTP